MEMARRGLSRTVTRLLEMGADADYNTQGYGDSTVLMSARDPEIMKKLLYYGANPMAVNAHRQTDFSYKLLKGFVAGARFYLYNTEKIPFQKLLDNFRDCILSRESTPYRPHVSSVPHSGGAAYGSLSKHRRSSFGRCHV